MGNKGSRESFQLKSGEPTKIGGNRPMKFKIYLNAGGYIEGVIPANEKLVICTQGYEIKDMDIIIDEDSTRTISAV
ncbi:MAG: hypothetical protein KA155_07410 [Alphaproteobacteria bacterium]|jgi:hypothetical protein|nr:hypothetical protein [Alphaproteobacteria bacterium]